VSVSGDFPFSFGSICNVPFNPLDEIQMITDAGPTDSADVFATPYAAFSVPMNGSDYPIQVPADANHSQAYTRTFQFFENAFDLYKEQTDGSDSLVTGIGSGGRVANSLDGLASSLYPKDMLQPHTRYKVHVQCGVDEIINGQSGVPAGGPVTQDTIFYFTTGAAPDHLVPENIDYSYPIASQRYLLQNEFSRRGTIRMARWQYNLLPEPSKVAGIGGYNYLVYFLDATGDTLTSAFTLNEANNSLDFQLPAGLKNSTIYDLQVWVIPRKNLMEMVAPSVSHLARQITNQVTANAPMSGFAAGGGSAAGGGFAAPASTPLVSTASINKNIVVLPAASHPLGSIPIFSLRFQTSQYNSFADKMAAYGQWTSKAEDNFHDISLYSQGVAPEEFDEFEIKGYTSTCTYCSPGADPSAIQPATTDASAAPATPMYPPMFGAVVPWNNNIQNDQYASNNLYANAFVLSVYGITVDLGAAQVRNLMHPVYTLLTDGIPYEPKLPPLSLQQSKYSASSNVSLPASYLSVGVGKSSASPASSRPSFFGQTLIKNTAMQVETGPRLLWQHDHYIYADYQLMQQFASSYLANQQNTIWLPSGTLPLALVQALSYGNPVNLAVGEYGSITADPTRYSAKWNDSTLTQMAQTLQGLPFQAFPPTAARPLQFGYQYPFCVGCVGSTVNEQFSYGNVINLVAPPVMKINNARPALLLKHY
jgi:hypothetical protein